MSDPDKADQDKGFLARWSQRKQEAKQPEPKQEAPVAAASDVPAEPIVAEVDAEPEFDLSSLPKLEELTGTTDITAFLKKGVPEHLRNAALRKSWALDPAIRNYVNPALEYAYDWNTPGGVPGGGELARASMLHAWFRKLWVNRRLKRQIPMQVPKMRRTLLPRNHPSAIRRSDEFQVKSLGQIEEPQAAIEHSSVTEIAAGESTVEIARKTTSSAAPQQPVRRHGSAKPIG